MQKLLLYIAILATTFTACQKEESVETHNNTGGGGTSNGSEIGTWNFIGLHAKTSSTVESTMFGLSVKTVTLSEYDTENNKGTIKFDGKKMIATGMEYTMSTTAIGYLYMDGSLEDSIAVPISYNLPPTSQSADYKKIGTDSIYFASGVMTIGNSGVQGLPAGYKLKWDGDKMIMTMNNEEIKNEVVQGVSQKTTNKVAMAMTLQKQ